MHFIDTHIHLQDFSDDFAPGVINNDNLEKMVLVCASLGDLVKVEKLIDSNPNKFIGAFGLHPWYWEDVEKVDEIKKYLIKYKNALVGEIGVDRLRGEVNDGQRKLFYKQLEIAKEFNRPVIIHGAKAFEELKEFRDELKKVKFVHHGFVKGMELIDFINECDGYIGIGALFLKQEKAKEMIKKMPMNRILFETDAPFRVSEEKYDEVSSGNLLYLAELMGENKEKMVEQLYQNAKEFLKC